MRHIMCDRFVARRFGKAREIQAIVEEQENAELTSYFTYYHGLAAQARSRLYQGEHFFAIIDDGVLYFITDDDTRDRYQSRGLKPFEYSPGKFLRTYYPVPVDVLENDTELQAWAKEAVEVQKRKGPRARRRKAATTRKKKT
jgi:TfoX/Sxy family transcriptional regulator of competence genes